MKLPGAFLICALAVPGMADEGLWLFNQFPKDQVKQKYNFEVTDQFLERLRLASLRIGSGSGSLVSADGLVFTTERVAADCLAKAGSTPHDYLRDGFYAAEREQELKCPDLQGQVLIGMEEVTKQVKDAAKEGAPPAEVLQKRAAAIARIEKSCGAEAGVTAAATCNVVKLSSGERYDLYRYKTYADLRLVFAPERAIAFFGGDAEKFTYPRYDFDVAFLRAYENGKPAVTPQYLKWSAQGVKDAELLFAAGSPATTSRLSTAAQLIFYRDVNLPFALGRMESRIGALRTLSAKSEENRRAVQPALSELGSRYKATAGLYIGLKDDRLMPRKANFEKKLRSAVEHDPKLGTAGGKVWDEVAAAYKTWTPFEKPYQVLESPAAEDSALFHIARQIVRIGEERAKPDEQRLPEYRDSALAATELALYSAAPIDDAIELALLTPYLEELKALGEKEAPVKVILGNRTPQQVAEELVHSTKLKDVAERKRLAADHAAALQSEDAMIRLARLLDAPARKLQKKHADTIETLAASSAERIAQYRYRLFGAADYPDATSTPRVTFGVVKAYRDRTEAAVPYATTFGGLYHLAGAQEPYKLPQRWVDAKPLLDLVMPLDFVSTCDTVGGNSGSPAVDQKGEIAGMVFDYNLEAIPLTYIYNDDQARAVHVASQGIVEALRKVYRAPELLRELGIREEVTAGPGSPAGGQGR